MASLRKRFEMAQLASAATTVAAFTWADAAFASQGPGGGPGTASSITQLTMAVIVYGVSALVIGAGLIGAVRALPGRELINRPD